ncbi:MAG: RNA methyltransferase [Pirellulales bacterium]
MSSKERKVGEEIRSPKNPWIQSLIRLHRVSERREQQRFLLEGSNLVLAAIEFGWPLDCVLTTRKWSEENGRQLHWLTSGKLSVRLVSEQVLKAVSATQTPEGVIAVAVMDEQPNELTLPSLGLALDEVQVPGNVGTLIRAAAATSADGVYLGQGSVDPFNDKLLRSTAGLWFSNRPYQVDLPAWIDRCQNSGIQVLGASADGQPFWEIDLAQPTLFVLGNEGSGLSSGIRSQISRYVSVPMNTKVESLNVAMAGTLLLYEAMRQRR